ncbi:MAG: putative D-isomer specific 2-hydroxyacid dehydrogenase NAD-binding [Candidatus Peregrinibacteria bacterium Greene0416_62]|nr:MAG: putative D-isomer specific 2-hydroxyacid dehydrogenase NAD-binding [Candidatus Peregrinibacteria bacterium Greene0416_62]TSC98586.1 MAG: putative D-isomer specific 2-hydroxyacid dehydrogenase NAD-binding [Candidatus Peregrinibacteria bacterium Greene1014_49]
MKERILCTVGDAYPPEAKRILESVGTVDYAVRSQKQIVKIIGKYDAVVVQLGVTFNEEVLKHAKKLRVIASATTATDHIDHAAAKKCGIMIISLKGEMEFLKTIPSTAEHTWGLLLALLRHIVPASNAVMGGIWNGKPFAGTELQGKTLGIIGVGRLGTIVAGYAKAFGLNVIGCDVQKIPASVCKQVLMDVLLRTSDIISLHVHLMPETQNLIGTAELKKIKSTAILLNTARGGIVDHDALLRALKAKNIAGYAADVLAGEMQLGTNCSTHPLVRYSKTHANVLLTPHIGGRTAEARAKTDIFIAEKVREVLS